MTFNELDNLFQTAKAKGRLGDMTFEQFSALGARATGDETMAEAAQAGPLSNKVRQFNSSLNRVVNASGADEFLGNQFGNLAEFVGVNRETGESVGQAIPRMALDVAPLAAGALALTAGAPAALAGTIGAGGLALSSALSGLGSYGDTGSLGQAAIAAATPAIAGKLAQFGGQAAMNYAAKGTSPFLSRLGVKGGTPLVKEVTQTLQGADVLPGTIMAGRVLSSMPDKIFNYLGQQAAVEGGLLGLDVLTQGTDAVFNKDYLFSNIVGNLAFAGMDIGDFRGTKMLPGETYTAPQVKPATEFMTGPEKLADTFRQTLGDAATPADRALAERAAGLDIARQVYTENLISNQQKLLQESKDLAVGKLTTAWEAQKQVDLSTPDLAPTLVALDKKASERTDIEKFLVERVAVTPALEKLVNNHRGELKKIQDNYTRSLNKFQLEPKEETLFGVPHETLKLTPEFLSKPLADRTQEDYDKALSGKLSDESIKIVQGMHRSQAGLPHVIGENVPYDNYLRALVDKSVKFNDPLGVVAAVAVARGEVPSMNDKKVKAEVEKGKKQGKTPSQIAANVNKKATTKLQKQANKVELADMPVPNLVSTTTEVVEPRPDYNARPAGESRSDFLIRQDAWDNKYAKTHNNDGTPIKYTVLDETLNNVTKALKSKSLEEQLAAIGTPLELDINNVLKLLINDGWVWDPVQQKMVDSQNRGEPVAQALARLKAKPVQVSLKKPTKAEIKKAEAQAVADKMRDTLNAVPEPVVVKAEEQPTGNDAAVAKRLNGLLSQAEPGKMEDTMFVRFVRGLLVGQGETIDGLKKALNERFGLPIKANLDELTDGMILTARAKMRQAPAIKTPEVGVYGEAELAKDAKVILANLKKVYGDDAEAGALVDLQALWDNPAFDTFKAKKNAFDVKVEQLQNRIAKKAKKSAKAADLPITAKGKEVEDLDEDDKVDLAENVEEGTEGVIDSFKTPEEEAAAIKEVQMRALLRSGAKIDAADHDAWWASLTPAVQKSRTKMAELRYANLQKLKATKAPLIKDYFDSLAAHLLSTKGWELRQPDKKDPTFYEIYDSAGKLVGKVERSIEKDVLVLKTISAAMSPSGERLTGQGILNAVYPHDAAFAKASKMTVVSDLIKDATVAKFKQYFGEGETTNGVTQIKMAASEGAEMPQVGFQTLKTVDEWADSTLEKSGIDAAQVPLYKQAWRALVDMFQSPEVRVGEITNETKQNLGTIYAAALEKQRQIFFNPEALAKLPPAERLAVNASLLAHEHGHIFIYKAKQGEFGPEAKKLIEDYETWVKTTDPRNVTDLVDVMAELHLGKAVKNLPGVADVITNLRNNRSQMDTDEVLANLLGVYAAGMNKVKEPSRFMTLMPKVVRDAFDWVGQQLQSVSQAVKLYTKLGFDSEQIKRAQGVADVFDAARRGARKAEENMEQLAVMANLTPGDVVDLGGKFAEGERYGVSGKPKSMVQSFLNNWIFKPAEVFRPHEFLHKPFVAMTDVSAAIGDETAVALAPMVGHLGVKNRLYVDKDTAWFRIRKSEQLSKLTNAMNIDMQKAEKEGTGAALEDDGQGGWKWNTAKLSPENRARWAQASKEQQELIAGFFAKRQMAMKHTQGVILNSEKGKYVSDLGKIISGQTAMAGRFGEGESMAQAIMNALGSGDQVALSRALMATPDETVRPQLLEMAKAYQESLNIRKQFYDTRPNFSSLRRFGAAVVKYAKGGKEETINYRSAAEAEAGETARVQDGWTVKSVKLNTQGKQEYKSGLDPELKKMLYDKEKRLKDIIATMPIDDGLRAELMSDLNFSEKLEIQEAAKDITSVRAERKFAAGMESLDVFEQDMLYITKAIRAAKLSELKAKVNSALRHPEAEMNPDVVATFKQVFENLLTPSSPWLQKMSKANAAWFLGMNIPGHFAELMQPVMTHLPELRAMGVSTWEGSKMIRQAQKEIAAVYAKAAKDDLFGKTKGTQYLADYWDKKDPNIADLLRRMVGKIDQGPLSGAYQELGFDQGQLASVINGDKPKTPVELAAAPFNAIANTSLKFYSLFTQHNAISALITGYRAARKLGMNHEEAIARAGLFDTTVNKSGGKANRQASAFKGDGLLGHIFYSLQGYSTGWFGQLAMYYQQGFDKQSYPKLSAAERNNAKAAFRNMLVAQVGMAGLMGLPFMGAGMALLEELTGEDLRSKLYEFVDEATGDPIIANMATHGMSSALADAFGIPVDLHSRFALGGFLGLNSYDGFSASSLFGPTASMVNGMWNMGKAVIQEHDVGKALALGGPTGLKNMAKALSEEIDPTTGLEPTMTGSLIKSLGFKSGQERKLQELKKIARNLNEADTRQTKQMAESIASQLGRGPRAVQSMLLENANKLATGEGQEYQQSMRAAVKSLAQKVAQVVESKQFPTDYRELASRRTAGNLGEAAQSLGLNLPPSTEVQRELTKMATYQAMGLSYRPNVGGALERQQQEFR